MAAAFTASGINLSSKAFEHGKRVVSVENDGDTLRVGGDDADTADTASLAVSGDVTLAGLMTMKTQSVSAQNSITIQSSHLVINPTPNVGAQAGGQANELTVNNPVAGMMLFIENIDDDDTVSTGNLLIECPQQTRCIFLYDGNKFQKFSQIDMI